MLLKVTKFNGRKDRSVSQALELSWEYFSSRLEKRRVGAYKWGDSEQNENAPLFSPVEYVSSLEGFTAAEDLIKVNRDREKYVAGKVWRNAAGGILHVDKQGHIIRANQNVKAVYMAVFDFDSHPAEKGKPEVIIRPEKVQELVKDLNHAIYSTHNSTDAYPRFRLVLPFKDPLSLADFKAGWPFGFEQQDESCKDLARMYLMPSVSPELEAQAFFFKEVEKKYFAPVIDKTAKKKKKKKAPRGDYETLDAETWFRVHGAEPLQVGASKFNVTCPWADQHTGGNQGATDTVLWVERGPNIWPTFSCSHDTCKRAGRDLQAVIKLWGDVDEYCARPLPPEKIKTSIRIKALGHDDTGKYYYQCNNTNHVVPLKANDHRELNFYSVCSDPTYWHKYYGDPDSGKVDWKKAARDMMAQCHACGFFKPNNLRGAGVWMDDGRLVVHLGKKLLVEGEETNLFDHKSEYVYEAMVKDVELREPASRENMRKTYDLISRLPFTASGHNVLLSGAIVCGYLSGILKWRPHLWMTGEPGTGKTAILRYVLAPLWTPMGGVYAEGGTTEAGLRQVEIRHNAVPIIVDESESNDRREIDRVAGIVRLARSSSSDSTANVVKGNTSATGHTYTVRSCFVLCSIVENLEHEQDKERFTVLEVNRTEASKKNWAALRADLENTFTKEFALGLYARVIDQADLIRANCDTFHQALMQNLPTVEARWCDQMGALLAGAWTLYSGEPVSHHQAWAYYQTLQGIKELAEKSETSIPGKALASLLAHIPLGQSKALGELVEANALAGPGWGDEAVLTRYGLKVRDGYLYVSSNHPQLDKIFRETGYPGHYNLLARIEGAVKGFNMRFGFHSSRSVRIPLPKHDEERTVHHEQSAAAARSRERDDQEPLAF